MVGNLQKLIPQFFDAMNWGMRYAQVSDTLWYLWISIAGNPLLDLWFLAMAMQRQETRATCHLWWCMVVGNRSVPGKQTWQWVVDPWQMIYLALQMVFFRATFWFCIQRLRSSRSYPSELTSILANASGHFGCKPFCNLPSGNQTWPWEIAYKWRF